MIHATDIKKCVHTEVVSVSSTSSVKRYEDYTCITDYSSKQYSIISKSKICSDGLLRFDGYICVALGQSLGSVGDKFIFTIGNKRVKIIMADAKADKDTYGKDGYTGVDGHIIEAIVCTSNLNSESKLHGDVNYTEALNGKITKIEKVIK